MKKTAAFILSALSLCAASVTAAQEPNNIEARREARRAAWAAMGIEEYVPPEIKTGTAEEIGAWDAPDATQGVAADENHFYAVANYVIGKYDRETGELVKRWIGKRGGLIGHLNSCYEEAGRLYCANSNHPNLPMASSIEIFDAKTMTHMDSKSLGILDEGSLVWFDHYMDGWIAGFAQYDDETGLPYKDHTYATVVTFDKEWRKTGGYALPASILEKMAPQAASGGAIGPDGRLYVMGHDLPEIYVLNFPDMGPTLVHCATIAVPAEGQAFDFDPEEPDRVWAISRPRGKVVSFRLPAME